MTTRIQAGLNSTAQNSVATSVVPYVALSALMYLALDVSYLLTLAIAIPTCGFLVRLAGPLSSMFGVCANAQANDDGRVVSWDHGCGAHSEAQLSKKSQPQPLPDPVLDTLSWDELEKF